MNWIKTHNNLVWLLVLAVLVAALFAPWTYTLDGVPPPEWCKPPNFLISLAEAPGGVSCAGLVPAVLGIGLYFSIGYQIVSRLLAGSSFPTFRLVEILGILLVQVCIVLLLLPCVSALCLALAKNSRRWQVFHCLAAGAAVGMCLLQLILMPPTWSTSFWGLWLYFWGLWLYLGVSAVLLVLAVFRLAARKQPIRAG